MKYEELITILMVSNFVHLLINAVIFVNRYLSVPVRTEDDSLRAEIKKTREVLRNWDR